MNKLPFLLLILTIRFGYAQTLGSSSPAYNYPYDTLIKMGAKSISSGKIIGASSPALGMMFLNRAIEVNKDRPEAYLEKGEGYRAYNMLNEALESYNTCLEVSPQNPKCLYGVFYVSFLGSTKYNIDVVPKPMMTQIMNSAKAFLAVAPADMLQEKANAKLLSNTFKLAIDNLDAFKKYNTNNVDNPSADNIKALEEVLPTVLATTNPVMTCSIYDKLIEYYFYVTKDYAKVKDYATKAIASGEAYTTTFYYLANTLYYQDKNSVEAEKICDAGLKHAPYNNTSNLKAEIIFTDGRKAYELKDYLKASTKFKAFCDMRPTNEYGFAYLGFSNFMLKKYPDAAKNLKTLKTNAEPLTVGILYPNLDALIAFAEKPGATAPVIKTTLPEHEKQRQIIGTADEQYDNKKLDEAVATYNSVLPYFEQVKNPVELTRIYTNLGFIAHDQKDYPKAKDLYNKAIAAGGYATEAYSNLAVIQMGVEKDYAAAEKTLKDGGAKFPDNSGIKKRYSQVYTWQADDAFDAKDYNKSITMYLKGLELYEDPEYYVFLGFSYYLTQQKDKCKEALETAKFLDPNVTNKFPNVDKVLDSMK